MTLARSISKPNEFMTLAHLEFEFQVKYMHVLYVLRPEKTCLWDIHSGHAQIDLLRNRDQLET